MKLFAFFLLIGLAAGAEIGQTAASSTIAPTAETTTTVSVQKSSSSSKEQSATKEPWYGEKLDIEDMLSCHWPSNFETIFDFCVNRTGVGSNFGIGPGGAEFGILDQDIVKKLLEKCSGGDCSNVKINRTNFVDRAELWWHHMDNITDFSKCLKKNTEGLVHMCESNKELSQTISGIAGLHLSIIDALTTAHKRVKEGENQSEPCLAKLSEAVHLTGAMYLTDRFYAKNTVQCWDVTKGVCSPMCKQFAYVLTCLQSVCPILSPDLTHLSIWEWHFSNAERSKNACGVQVDKAQCQSDSITVPSVPVTTPPPNDFMGKSKVALDKMKQKFDELKDWVEVHTHLKFFQFSLIAGGGLAIFIGIVLLSCMWYHGLICQRKKRRTLRYAKLVPEDMRRKTDETKSLTNDYDDVE